MPRQRGGAAPKSPDQIANPTRARSEAARMRVVENEAVPAPELPDYLPNGEEWPEHSLEWWKVWSNSPLTEDYREEDWQDLIDCATIHGMFWSTGHIKFASELRLRMARHGATREDRARLRIVFASADAAEKKSKTTNEVDTHEPKGSRTRRRGLRAAEETG